MTDHDMIVRYSSRDPRDNGAFDEKVLGRSQDGVALRMLAQDLTEHASNARAAFFAGPSDRSFEDRHASMEPYERLIAEWFDVSLKGDDVSFHVREVREHPEIDAERLKALRASRGR
jgi:hypothetical protein